MADGTPATERENRAALTNQVLCELWLPSTGMLRPLLREGRSKLRAPALQPSYRDNARANTAEGYRIKTRSPAGAPYPQAGDAIDAS